MNPKEKALVLRWLSKLGVLIALLLYLTGDEASRVPSWYVPFSIIFVIGVIHVLYSRCPSCRKYTELANRKVKFCPRCGFSLEDESE